MPFVITMISSYTEDHLIEQSAVQLRQHELDREVVNCYDEPSAQMLRRSGWNPAYQHLIADLPAVEKSPRAPT